MNLFATEWQVLQNQYDSYEKYSLVIKLAAILIASVCLLNDGCWLYCAGILAILWLQDGIWKTFQARIEQRLYFVEEQIAQADAEPSLACQYNRHFIATRKSGAGLIKEYIVQALRPTVAFPHAVLVLMVCLKAFF